MGRFFKCVGKVLKWVGLSVLFAFVAFVGYCTIPYPSYEWHQKMVVEVEVQGKIYKGESVSRAHVARSVMMQGTAYPGTTDGEAVVVTLPGPRYLFALRRSEKEANSYLYPLFFRVHKEALANLSRQNVKDLRRGNAPSWAPYVKKLPRKKPYSVAGNDKLFFFTEYMPLLVTFDDIKDPKTVKQVDPNNLAATFGPGVSLRQITLEITDEPVTKGTVETVLGWIKTEVIPVNRELPYGHPMSNILNQDFRLHR